jgi:Type ISP C-terminal specificity domain
LTEHLELFRALARLGGELVALHLLESPKLDQPITEFIGGRNPEVEKISWSKNTVWVDKEQTAGFKGVREDVWNFHVGGYQVCEKWLKDRKGRKLLKADIEHYQKIVVALAETIRLMKEIDELIEKHGGWPGAFKVATVGAASTAPKVERPVTDIKPAKQALKAEKVNESLPLFEAAEPAKPAYTHDHKKQSSEARVSADEIDREELMCAIRQLFSDGQGRSRDEAIKDLSRQLGYERVGPRISEELSNAIKTAVRRGILANNNDALEQLARTISDYGRDFLKDQFLASLQGRTWEERDVAVRHFSRWFGFLRTGPVVDETTRSLINGLLRENRLESEGSLIRRC